MFLDPYVAVEECIYIYTNLYIDTHTPIYTYIYKY